MSKILLVDDEVGYLEGMVRILKIKGYECLIESDGNKVIDVYRQEKPDVLLLDLNLGEGKASGFDILKEIRQTDSQTKVIVISGVTKSDKEVVLVKELGADGFIAKPLDLPGLFVLLEQLLADKK